MRFGLTARLCLGLAISLRFLLGRFCGSGLACLIGRLLLLRFLGFRGSPLPGYTPLASFGGAPAAGSPGGSDGGFDGGE